MWPRRKPAAGPPPLSALDQLALVPVRNAAAQVVEDTPDRLVLGLPLTYPRLLGPLPRLMRLRPAKRFELTELGLLVWRRIDDRTTLGQLVDWLAEDQVLAFNESRLLLLTYLHLLSRNGLVVLGDRKVDGAGAP